MLQKYTLKIFKIYCLLVIFWSLSGWSTPHKMTIQFLNEQVLKHNVLFQKIPVGGLSALSYDPINQIFFALSDDKGHKGPLRFYKLKLKKTFWTKKYRLQIKSQSLLKRPDKKPLVLDPEGIAFLAPNQIIISSEGAQIVTKKLFKPSKKKLLSRLPASTKVMTQKLLEPPLVLSFNTKGRLKTKWPLPSIFWPKNLKKLKQWGVKENKAFEALSIDPSGKFLWLATESSLKQDQTFLSPSTQPTCKTYSHLKACGKQYIRISQFHIPTQKMIKQFVYIMPQIIKEAQPSHHKGKNGLTDFISLKNKQFLIIERSYLKDSLNFKKRKMDKNQVRLVLSDCSIASNVMRFNRLNKLSSFIPCQNKQTIWLSNLLPNRTDNIEGIALGPKLSSKNQLMVLVSDNNFNPKQKTQFLFFNLQLNEKENEQKKPLKF